MVPCVQLSTFEPQYGSGMNGGGVEITLLSIEAALTSITSQGKRAAAIYIDIASAFAEVALCLVMPE